jgi:hypothetical protein
MSIFAQPTFDDADSNWPFAGKQSIPTQTASESSELSSGKASSHQLLLEQVKQVFAADLAALIDNDSSRLHSSLRKQWWLRPQFPTQSIAIECGPKAANLCVFFVSDENAVAEFCNLNPAMAQTLITMWSGFHCIWMRLSGWVPPNIANEAGYWFSSGSVPVLNVTNPETETFTTTNKILAAPFESMQWPKVFADAFGHAGIEALHGPFFETADFKKTAINHATAARIFARALQLRYDINSKTFRQQVPKGRSTTAVSTVQVMNLLTQCLLDMAAKTPHDFPAHELEPAGIKALIESVKKATAYFRTDADQGMLEFIQRRLRRVSGQSVSVEEIYRDYNKFVELWDMIAMPRAKFCRELPKVILETFTISRVNNVLRPVDTDSSRSTARRGFLGLALKTDGLDGSDGGDVLDGMDGIKKL